MEEGGWEELWSDLLFIKLKNNMFVQYDFKTRLHSTSFESINSTSLRLYLQVR